MRRMPEDALPVCNDTNASNAGVLISLMDPSSTNARCKNNGPRNKNTTEMPDDLELWQEYREENGGSALAYIFAKAKGGEFFTYNGEGKFFNAGYYVGRNGGGWGKTYTVTEETSLYLVDERRYRLRNGVLELIVNGNETEANILKVVNNVTDFQVRAVMKDASERSDLSNIDTTTEDWKNIRAIRVTLSVDGRSLTSEFYPRNISSR